MATIERVFNINMFVVTNNVLIYIETSRVIKYYCKVVMMKGER